MKAFEMIRMSWNLVKLVIRSLPRLDAASSYMYRCRFGRLSVQDASVSLTTNTSEVRCFTPARNRLPPNVPGKAARASSTCISSLLDLQVPYACYHF